MLFQAELGPSEIYGGPLNGFFFADLNPNDGVFAGEANLTNVDLSLGSEILFRKKGVRGEAKGSAKVEGIVGSPESVQGDGEFYDGRVVDRVNDGQTASASRAALIGSAQ